MIKVGNVWYPSYMKKLAIEAFHWRHRAWLTSYRKRLKYGRYSQQRRINDGLFKNSLEMYPQRIYSWNVGNGNDFKLSECDGGYIWIQ